MELYLHLYSPYLILWRLQQQIHFAFFHHCFIPFLYIFRTSTLTFTLLSPLLLSDPF